MAIMLHRIYIIYIAQRYCIFSFLRNLMQFFSRLFILFPFFMLKKKTEKLCDENNDYKRNRGVKGVCYEAQSETNGKLIIEKLK